MFGRGRLFLCWAALLVLAGATIWQLYQIQIIQGPLWAGQARQINSQLVPLEDFNRGDITDRHGISLLGGYWANRLVLFPSLMPEQADNPAQMARLAGLSPRDLKNISDPGQPGPFIVNTPLTEQQYQKFNSGHWPGVYVLPVYHRYGPQPLAAHLVGHLGKIDSMVLFNQLKDGGGAKAKTYHWGDWVGRAGLELFYERDLKGSNGGGSRAGVAVDARGRIVEGDGITVDTAAQEPGRLSVVTTIDERVQRIVENLLDQHVTTGAVVVMQAGSGDILAMASRPNYHPQPSRMQDFIQVTGGEVFVNHATALYQPGSVFKVILAAAALEQNLDNLNQPALYHCDGADARPVCCWHARGHGDITLSEALAQSCNPAFVQLAQKLGAAAILHYASLFGLTNQLITGYPIPGDNRQDLTLMGDDFNLSNSAVGQGPVLVTPVQVTAMINVIASGGVYHQPRLVLGLRDERGKMVQKIAAPDPESVISGATAKELQTMLRQVTETGVGQKAAVPVWGSAGKTGSAQLTSAKGPVNAWFTGYVPAVQPRYVITVLIPGGDSGGATAAPLFRQIADRLMELK